MNLSYYLLKHKSCLRTCILCLPIYFYNAAKIVNNIIESYEYKCLKDFRHCFSSKLQKQSTFKNHTLGYRAVSLICTEILALQSFPHARADSHEYRDTVQYSSRVTFGLSWQLSLCSPVIVMPRYHAIQTGFRERSSPPLITITRHPRCSAAFFSYFRISYFAMNSFTFNNHSFLRQITSESQSLMIKWNH